MPALNATPLAEKFSLADIINGLSDDLKARRAGSITIEDARVRAEMAKQIICGVRLYVQAQKMLEGQLKPALPSKRGNV
jgi:hypothetical protein